MLPKCNRLKSRHAFKQTLGAYRLFICPYFVLYAHGTKPVKPSRFGFIVSKKVHKHAVQRNKVKRQLRSLVRLYLLSVRDHKAGTLSSRYASLVFIARKPILEVPFERLVNEIQKGSRFVL
jgi:ribonuclease P protein component